MLVWAPKMRTLGARNRKGHARVVDQGWLERAAWVERVRARARGDWFRHPAQPGAWRSRLNQFWRRLPDAFVLGLLGAIHSLFGRPFLFAPMTFDEHFFLFEGFSLGRGLVPYPDFQELKPPAILLVNMLALRLGGLQDFSFATSSPRSRWQLFWSSPSRC